jgi:hypothetical protein
LNDGVTVVSSNSAYTLTQIQGMQFRHTTNAFGGPAPFSFTVTDNGTTAGAPAPLTLTQSLNITVIPAADPPSVTPATTFEGMMTTNGLVLSRNPVDGPEVAFLQITGITNGTLFQNDGTSAIANNSFITFAQGNAGLKFSPTPGIYKPNATFGFTIRLRPANSVLASAEAPSRRRERKSLALLRYDSAGHQPHNAFRNALRERELRSRQHLVQIRIRPLYCLRQYHSHPICEQRLAFRRRNSIRADCERRFAFQHVLHRRILDAPRFLEPLGHCRQSGYFGTAAGIAHRVPPQQPVHVRVLVG